MGIESIEIGIIDDNEKDANRTINILRAVAEKENIDIATHFFELPRDGDKLEEKNDGAVKDFDDLFKKLEAFFTDNNTPKALLIDFILSASIARLGSSLALRIKEEQLEKPFLKEIPIIAISGVKKDDKRLTEHREHEFIDIFDRTDLQQKSLSIFKIAEDYSSIVSLSDENEKEELLIDLLNVPDDSQNLFLNAVETEFKKEWDLDTPHSFARWIWKVFLSNPGFLLNEVYSSALLGLKPEAFNKIKGEFEEALYDGVFNIENDPRWWKEKLTSILTKKVRPDEIMPIWKRGHLLDDLTDDDFLECEITGKKETKIIPAFIDEEREELHPISYDLTIKDPEDNIKVGFDAKRIYKG